MSLSPSNWVSEQITGQKVFPNMAGKKELANVVLIAELTEAGILVHDYSFNAEGEVGSTIAGSLYGWSFKRAWYYWVAKGPGLPPYHAHLLHQQFGKEVRVDGHCGCPSPLEWYGGFACNNYHVDTQRGLNALAAMIRLVAEHGEALAKFCGQETVFMKLRREELERQQKEADEKALLQQALKAQKEKEAHANNTGI